ncbi:MAG: glycoside hydrolase family 28 protein, partial [Candidatus Omnitrophica bacterium]|nr:glycoside hydrolase family 28 protein [Candidatus Omnitrophota bacterium]
LFAAILLATSAFGASKESFNVLDFGAVGDGEAVETQALQNAIEACAQSGGGTVLFPAGNYVSGTLFLRDHVNLHLVSGATLLGSTDLEDFPLTLCSFASYTDNYCGRALLWADGATDIGITGNGTIDGRGAAFRTNRPDDEVAKQIASDWTDETRYIPAGRYINRPYIIRFVSCNKVRVDGITLQNSPMWMQHYLNCDNVWIHGIKVYNHVAANNDMIDIDCCRDVLISDCIGDSDDDALTLKSTADTPTENVTITNCVLSSHCNALKLGTESSGGFKNISITNCVIRPSRDTHAESGRDGGLAGIALEIVDGGAMDRVTLSNIAIHGETAPIFIRLGNRGRQFRPNVDKPAPGTLRNVLISNIVATEAESQGCSITGVPGAYAENVSLSNIRISFKGGVKEPFAGEVPEVENKYPECTMFGDLPSYGFYCRHVKGLSFSQVDLSFHDSD